MFAGVPFAPNAYYARPYIYRTTIATAAVAAMQLGPGAGQPAGWTCYEDPNFLEGFAVLEKLNLSFDHCGLHTQIRPLVKLARTFPKVAIICDHCGCPTMVGPYVGKGAEIFEQWKLDMAGQ